MTPKILLNYSTDKTDRPVIASIIKETGVLINILHADLTPKGGEILIEVDESEAEINDLIKLFEERGVDTKKITRGVSLDEETCLDCGACVSLCPTKAIQIDEDYSIILEEEKCVHCGACVPACPVNALYMEEF